MTSILPPFPALWVAALAVIWSGITPLSANPWAEFTAEQQTQLQAGETVTWCDPFPNDKKRCLVRSAILLDAPQARVWTLLDDKESAPEYIGDLQSCKVLSSVGNLEVIEQRTRPPGVPKSFTYLLNYWSDAPHRMHFTRRSGDLRHIEGSWDFVSVGDGQTTLVTYSLHIDPGKLVPRQMVCRQQQKRLPAVLFAVRDRLAAMPNLALCCGAEAPEDETSE